MSEIERTDHTDRRGPGPDYSGEWDGKPGVSPQRVCAYAAQLLTPIYATMPNARTVKL